ncbi:phosphoglycerate kinase [Striga asiatica]|uniref:Phosphoglycerate kinase n=1 Tax=Striga asiatica TaxID=4170 RepID=A0A5A7QEV0_STRAF|nr:phosphoglycerate kinase [Striga asiatica]
MAGDTEMVENSANGIPPVVALECPGPLGVPELLALGILHSSICPLILVGTNILPPPSPPNSSISGVILNLVCGFFFLPSSDKTTRGSCSVVVLFFDVLWLCSSATTLRDKYRAQRIVFAAISTIHLYNAILDKCHMAYDDKPATKPENLYYVYELEK